jgi:hypothetical protein
MDEKAILRFCSKVKRGGPDDCWEWQGYRDRMGYGQVGMSGPRRNEYAHRVAWMIVNGPIPDRMCVLHRCDNPACCNPAHHFLGTRSENMADKVRKGRQHRGERHPRARLDEHHVRAIRSMREGGLTHQRIADAMGVSRNTVTCVLNGRNWKHVA